MAWRGNGMNAALPATMLIMCLAPAMLWCKRACQLCLLHTCRCRGDRSLQGAGAQCHWWSGQLHIHGTGAQQEPVHGQNGRLACCGAAPRVTRQVKACACWQPRVGLHICRALAQQHCRGRVTL